MTTPGALNPAQMAQLIDTYLAAWNEPDAMSRRRLLASAWAADGIYTDPQSHGANRDELDAIIDGFHRSSPGAGFTLDGPVSHHHHVVRFYWTLRFANAMEVPGMDYGEIGADGKLAKIVGFF